MNSSGKSGERAAGASPAAVALGLGLVVAGLFVASLLTGQMALPLHDLLRGGDSVAALVLAEIRLPRAILALVTGASLGLSGAALQGLLLNPLAEPALIGVTGTAALGAVVAFYFGLAALFPLALPLGGILGALAAVGLIFALAGRNAGTLALILAGVAVNSLAASLTALALNLAPSPYAASEIVFWLLGSFADRSLADVGLILPFVAVGWALFAGAGRGLDALTLGEDTARTLGVGLTGLRWRIVIGTTLAVGAGTAVAGSIGFIGLVVPHLLRRLMGYRPGALLLVSALGGGALALAADIAVRLIETTPELRLGVLTALIGAPFFLWLVMRTRRELA